MSSFSKPSFEPRRTPQLREELLARARNWLPQWRLQDGSGELGLALLSIAARLSGEVAQRLDRIPEKTFRNFFSWLGVSGQAGRAARVPVVFTLTAKAKAVDAAPPVQLQATTQSSPIVLETQSPLRLLPGKLAQLVGVDPTGDAFTQPPFALGVLEAPKPLPDEWRLKSEVGAGSTQLQLEPALGLTVGMTLSEPTSGLQYRVRAVAGNIVSIDPALGTGAAAADSGIVEAGQVFRRVKVFEPFGAASRNQQEHALYIGATEALDLETPLVVEIRSERPLATDATWSFWGKRARTDAPSWIELQTLLVEQSRVLLLKPTGSVENEKIGGLASRWLRATRTTGSASGVESGGLRLRINCSPDDDAWPQSVDDQLKAAGVNVEKAPLTLDGIANTAPLVLNAPFYPLGREPRLFDAFYLASKEAFSKAHASVTLDFNIGDGFSTPLVAARFSSGLHLLVAVGADHKLRRLSVDASQPIPTVTFLPSPDPPILDGVPVELNASVPPTTERGQRPGALALGNYALFSVGAGSSVWLRLEFNFTNNNFGLWLNFERPSVPKITPAIPVVDTTLTIGTDGVIRVYAVWLGTLYQRRFTTQTWNADQPSGLNVQVKRIAAFQRITDANGSTTAADELLCVTSEGELFYVVGRAVGPSTWRKVDVRDFAEDLYPLALIDTSDRRLVYGQASAGKLTALELDLSGTGIVKLRSRKDQDDVRSLKGRTLSWALREQGRIAVVAAMEDSGRAVPVLWDAFAGLQPVKSSAALAVDIYEGPVTIGTGNVQVFPGSDAVSVMTTGDVTVVSEVRADNWDAVLLDIDVDLDAGRPLFVELGPDAHRLLRPVREVLSIPDVDNRFALTFDERLEPNMDVSKRTLIYEARNDAALVGTLTSAPAGETSLNTLELDDDDTFSSEDDNYLFVINQTTGQHALTFVTAIDAATHTATIRPLKPTEMTGGEVTYWSLSLLDAPRNTALRPVLDLRALDPEIRRTLKEYKLKFASGTPALQTASDVLDAHNRAILASPWQDSAPPKTEAFAVIQPGVLGDPRVFEPPRPRNPELFWEYWNGTAWWRIPQLTDNTANFLHSGTVVLCVPEDLGPTEVMGRRNHWIRARLVGGDYGHETVTLTSAPGTTANTTIQTVSRNNDSVRAPFVVEMTAGYSVCCPITPDYVLTLDAASFRDQTNANNLEGATVEHFVPLAQLLAPLDRPEFAAAASGRALYLGFDTELKGGPISVLFMVEEGQHDAAFPLQVDALLGGQFRAIAVEDGTRGLNESGTLSFTLAESPQLTELFGQARYWLRVRPSPLLGNDTLWQPKIRAAYLNAGWAIAAETQALELLGSSDGAPNQRLALARPPVLEGSLELRVREPLADEEIAALRATDPAAVRDQLGPRSGPWVLWREVVDPLDSSAGERVYALDAASGELTFGDGLHGRIPPIGRDAILAVRYARGGGELANHIAPWSPISLLTPLAGVDAAILPAAPAGGSDPQGADDTLRFAPANLRLRERALTLRDFEQLALQFSVDVAQVRAFSITKGVRVVVVMRGPDPLPSSAQRRELVRYLSERASPALQLPAAMQVLGPELVPLRVQLAVTILTLGSSAAVTQACGARIAALLDPATGADGEGWPLGTVPSDADIAAALSDIPELDTLDALQLLQTAEDGSLQPLAASLRPRQLVHLVTDGVSVECTVADVEGAA